MLGKYGKPYYDFKEVKNETRDKKRMIGYNFKEIVQDQFIAKENWNNLNLNASEIHECIEIHNLESEKKIKVENTNYIDITPLNPKNATQLLLNFIEEKNIKDIDRDLQIESIRQGYCWLGLGKSQILRLFRQIKIMRKEESQFDLDKIYNDQNYIESDPEKQLNYILSTGKKDAAEKYICLYDNKLLTDNELKKLTNMDIQELKSMYQ